MKTQSKILTVAASFAAAAIITVISVVVCLQGAKAPNGGGGAAGTGSLKSLVSTSASLADNGEALSNPLMGWQYYAFPEEIVNFGTPEGFDVVNLFCSWDKTEPTRGNFDFSALDAAVAVLKAEKKTVNARLYLMPDNVWNIKGYPDWVKTADGLSAADFKADTADGGTIQFNHAPYANPVYLGLIRSYLTAFNAHFGDGAFDVIDLRCFGLAGEWDSGWGNYWIHYGNKPDGGSRPEGSADGNYGLQDPTKKAVMEGMVDVYADAFNTDDATNLTKIAINVAGGTSKDLIGDSASSDEAAYNKYLDISGLGFAISRGIILRSDAVNRGDKPATATSSDFMARLHYNYPDVPVYGETADGSAYFNQTPDSHVNSYVNHIKGFYDYGANSISFGFFSGDLYKFNLPLSAGGFDKAKFAEQLKGTASAKQTGYRLLPTALSYSNDISDGTFTINSAWTNYGAGLLYRKYGLCIRLYDAATTNLVYKETLDDFDLSTLHYNGVANYNKTFNLPSAAFLPLGNYKVTISLVDAQHKNAIALPIGAAGNTAREYEIGTAVRGTL
jgi:hypothetical protein